MQTMPLFWKCHSLQLFISASYVLDARNMLCELSRKQKVNCASNKNKLLLITLRLLRRCSMPPRSAPPPPVLLAPSWHSHDTRSRKPTNYDYRFFKTVARDFTRHSRCWPYATRALLHHDGQITRGAYNHTKPRSVMSRRTQRKNQIWRREFVNRARLTSRATSRGDATHSRALRAPSCTFRAWNNTQAEQKVI